jgi:Arc/MetJ-type ribon-helix-helix transcriptional regulator
MITIHLPSDLEDSIRAELASGHFASEDELVVAAVRDYLRQRSYEQTERSADCSTPGMTQPGGVETPGDNDNNDDPLGYKENERNRQELQHRLFAAGLISEIKPPITDLTPWQNRRAIPIQGEPISETVIRERR